MDRLFVSYKKEQIIADFHVPYHQSLMEDDVVSIAESDFLDDEIPKYQEELDYWHKKKRKEKKQRTEMNMSKWRKYAKAFMYWSRYVTNRKHFYEVLKMKTIETSVEEEFEEVKQAVKMEPEVKPEPKPVTIVVPTAGRDMKRNIQKSMSIAITDAGKVEMKPFGILMENLMNMANFCKI